MANRYESESDRMRERGRGGEHERGERSRYEGWGSENRQGAGDQQGRGERYNSGSYESERYGQGQGSSDWQNQHYRGRETYASQWGTQGGSQSAGGGGWGQGSYASRGMENYGP